MPVANQNVTPRIEVRVWGAALLFLRRANSLRSGLFGAPLPKPSTTSAHFALSSSPNEPGFVLR